MTSKTRFTHLYQKCCLKKRRQAKTPHNTHIPPHYPPPKKPSTYSSDRQEKFCLNSCITRAQRMRQLPCVTMFLILHSVIFTICLDCWVKYATITTLSLICSWHHLRRILKEGETKGTKQATVRPVTWTLKLLFTHADWNSSQYSKVTERHFWSTAWICNIVSIHI